MDILKATIQFKEELHIQNLDSLLAKLQFKKREDHYILNTIENKRLVDLVINEDEYSLTLTFANNLAFKDYERIHHLIDQLANDLNGVVDDKESLLGYLQNGEGAHIHTNWDQWAAFLTQARYKTLEGQMVKVLKEDGQELGSGLLVEYTFNSRHHLEECKLVTMFGEKTFKGEKLEIIPG